MNTPYKILMLALTAIGLSACDSVDEANRFVESEGINPDQKVLVEEFTGQFCPNCPLGHLALDNIKSLYGENAVIVSIHAGDQAFDDPDYGLKTAEGDVYAAAYNMDAYPFAVVNRNKANVMSDRSQWQGAVFNAARTAPKAGIQLLAHIVDDAIVVESNLKSRLEPLSAYYQVWVTEDDIVAMQDNNGEYLMDYVHNHVYRASVNGIGGEAVSISEEGTTLTHTIALNEKWNRDNLNIVAFLHDSNGVLQAAETNVE